MQLWIHGIPDMTTDSDTPGTSLAGAGCAVLAMGFFAVNDAVIKFLSGDYALHEVILFRALFGLGMSLLVLVPLAGGFSVLRTRKLGRHLLRGMCVVMANLSFFLGLAAMPLAECVALFFISPLVITVLSAMILRESVGPWRWSAVALGLAGVLAGVVVIIRPGVEAFQMAALFPIIGAFFYAVLNIFTRTMGGTEKAATLTIYIQITFVIVCAFSGLLLGHGRFDTGQNASLSFLLRAWVVPEAGDWVFFAALGAASSIGGYFISQAYRISEAGFVAPFEYVAMPIAVLSGLVLFGEWPDNVAWIGIALIVAAGLLQLWRENVRARQSRGQKIKWQARGANSR